MEFDLIHCKEATYTWPDIHSFWRFDTFEPKFVFCFCPLNANHVLRFDDLTEFNRSMLGRPFLDRFWVEFVNSAKSRAKNTPYWNFELFRIFVTKKWAISEIKHTRVHTIKMLNHFVVELSQDRMQMTSRDACFLWWIFEPSQNIPCIWKVLSVQKNIFFRWNIFLLGFLNLNNVASKSQNFSKNASCIFQCSTCFAKNWRKWLS